MGYPVYAMAYGSVGAPDWLVSIFRRRKLRRHASWVEWAAGDRWRRMPRAGTYLAV